MPTAAEQKSEVVPQDAGIVPAPDADESEVAERKNKTFSRQQLANATADAVRSKVRDLYETLGVKDEHEFAELVSERQKARKTEKSSEERAVDRVKRQFEEEKAKLQGELERIQRERNDAKIRATLVPHLSNVNDPTVVLGMMGLGYEPKNRIDVRGDDVVVVDREGEPLSQSPEEFVKKFLADPKNAWLLKGQGSGAGSRPNGAKPTAPPKAIHEITDPLERARAMDRALAEALQAPK